MDPVETVNLKPPQQLYLDWEGAHWAAREIDLSRDPADWAALEGSERDLLYWVLSSLMVAEAVRETPELADVVRDRILDLLPVVAESISPPSEGAWDVLGVEDGALAEFGLGALNRRLALIGVSLDG